jgi:hypothetical protein
VKKTAKKQKQKCAPKARNNRLETQESQSSYTGIPSLRKKKMENEIEQDKIQILIINDDFSETADIKSWLDEGMRIPWGYLHCISVSEAGSRINNVDLVILKPEMAGDSSPLQVFDDIDGMVFEVPIIVLTSTDDEHGLSSFVMEKGAADIVVRGKFERLVDAIEFSLIRQKITTKTRKLSDKTLQDSEIKAAGKLQNSKDLRKKDRKESAIRLQNSNDQREKDQEEGKKILSMFMGDYSATNNDTKKQ